MKLSLNRFLGGRNMLERHLNNNKVDGMRIECMRDETFIINPGQKVRSQFFNQKLSKIF